MLIDHLPAFDTPVPTNGYRWWYLDGISDDESHGIAVIAFIGSVFSPYYYHARHKGHGDPYNFCAINVALYSPTGNAWTMTERGSRQLGLSPGTMSLARSSLSATDDELSIEIDERSAPLPSRVQGSIAVQTPATNGQAFFLDGGQRHRWQPIATTARIDVEFVKPRVHWRGNAYLDTNSGDRPLEADFLRWNWCRFRYGDSSRIHYSVVERNSGERSLALTVDPFGAVREHAVQPTRNLRASRWGIQRATQNAATVTTGRMLEDTPFYTRSLLEVDDDGQKTIGVHESLSLQRFEQAWVRCLLPFRMPRITR